MPDENVLNNLINSDTNSQNSQADSNSAQTQNEIPVQNNLSKKEAIKQNTKLTSSGRTQFAPTESPDILIFDEEVAKGEKALELDTVGDENYYYIDENGEEKKASFGDRFKNKLATTFRNEIATLPAEIVMDSMYNAFVGHYVRDLTKNISSKIFSAIADKLSNFKKVVCDITFSKYGSISGGLAGSAVKAVAGDDLLFKASNIIELSLFANHIEDRPKEAKSNSDTEKEFVPATTVYMMSDKRVAGNENEVIGSLKVELAFTSSNQITAWSNLLSDAQKKDKPDHNIISAKLEFRTISTWFGASFNNNSINYDIRLLNTGPLKIDYKDAQLCRQYEFEIINRTKPDCELTLPDTFGSKIYQGYFDFDTFDQIKYHIDVEPSGNTAATMEFSIANTVPESLSPLDKPQSMSDVIKETLCKSGDPQEQDSAKVEKVVYLFTKAKECYSPQRFLNGYDLFALEVTCKSVERGLKGLKSGSSFSGRVGTDTYAEIPVEGHHVDTFTLKYSRPRADSLKPRTVAAKIETARSMKQSKLLTSDDRFADI